MNEFDWPCDKRTAHEAHQILRPRVGPAPLGSAVPVLQGFDKIECPGVKAHPATAIGGNYVSERKD